MADMTDRLTRLERIVSLLASNALAGSLEAPAWKALNHAVNVQIERPDDDAEQLRAQLAKVTADARRHAVAGRPLRDESTICREVADTVGMWSHERICAEARAKMARTTFAVGDMVQMDSRIGEVTEVTDDFVDVAWDDGWKRRERSLDLSMVRAKGGDHG